MKTITIEEAKQIIHAQNGFDNGSFKRKIRNAKLLYYFTIEDSEFLYKLIWHYRKETQVLTPGTWYGGKLYTIGDVADYMIEQGWTLEDLHQGKVKGTYSPDWFESCTKIATQFDYAKFGVLFVQPAHHHEKRDCPYSLFRSIDGAHRLLTLSYLLKTKQISFSPMPIICVVEEKKK